MRHGPRTIWTPADRVEGDVNGLLWIGLATGFLLLAALVLGLAATMYEGD